MAVLVIQPSLADDASETGSDWAALEETAQAEQLDMELASWDSPGGPPIVTEVRHDAPIEQLRALADTLGLAVLQVDFGTSAAAEPAVRAALGELRIPVLVVPVAPPADRPAACPVGEVADDRSVVSV
jgi:hypothetical protein